MIQPSMRPNTAILGKALSAAMLLAFSSLEAPATTNISGTVRNLSLNQPAASDEVILLRLDRGLQRETHAKTGPQGSFSLHVQYPAKSYLVRVVHQGVAYDRRASAGDILSIEVFDAAPRVSGITSTIEILRAGTNGDLLHISDLYELKNDSSPPVTLASDRSFEVYLPENAKLDSVLAAGPEKIGALITADPVPGEPGHYTVRFPLRPGETKFAFNYDLRYHGAAAFQTKRAYPLQQLAVMIPPTMSFSSHSPSFELLATGRSDYQVQIANLLGAGEGPAFEVSGTGQLPPLGNEPSSLVPSQPTASSQSSAVSGPAAPATGKFPLSSSPRAVELGKQVRPASQTLVPIGLTAVFLAVCGLLVWRARKFHQAASAR
jgi:hypothetical protein